MTITQTGSSNRITGIVIWSAVALVGALLAALVMAVGVVMCAVALWVWRSR